MIFPNDPLLLPRHPSQLYEAFLEGFVLFIILNVFIKKPRPAGSVAGLFLVGYGIFRFIVEYVREPEVESFLGIMTRGQALCLPMIWWWINYGMGIQSHEKCGSSVRSFFMKQYLDLCRRIVNEGEWVANERTGKRCLTVINADLEYDVANNQFPLITTRKSYWKAAIAEFLGYIRGYDNAEDFRKLGTKTWDANAK